MTNTKTMNKYIALILLAAMPLMLFAEKKTSVTDRAWTQAKKTYTKPVHYIGLSPKIGYSQFPITGSDLSFPGGLNAGLEFRYKMEYNLFRMTVGIDGTYAGNSAKGTIQKEYELVYPDLSTYNFDFSSIKESQSTFEVGVPILFGADIYKGLYAMAGVRVGLPLMSSYSVNTDFTRWIKDGKGIDPYTDLGNHQLFSDSKDDKGKMNLKKFNPQIALEIGYNLDPYMASKAAIPAPPKSNGKNEVKQKLPFAQLLHYEVALYANIGVMDYHQTPATGATFYTHPDSQGKIANIYSVTKDSELASGKMLPWNAGVRFNVYYEFYEQPPVKKAKKKKKVQPKPEVVDTVVVEPEIIPQDTIVYNGDTIQAGDTIVMENLFFDNDRTNIRHISDNTLDELADLLQRHPSAHITLIGHTDNVGTEEYNQRLSEGRVNSVKAELVKRGIDANRINTIGKGESEPIADNSTPEGRAENRRVEVVFDEIIVENIQTQIIEHTPAGEQPQEADSPDTEGDAPATEQQ
ncbi:MAG: OmpA family protein [Paludibacteraceae bacterium]|nr:OmpA family protein [Paludibacteraceae bacterium]